MRAKQTGSARVVKTGLIWAVGGAFGALMLLAGCAGPSWVNSNKTPEEMRADEKECSRQAEDYSLLRAGKPREDYALPPSGPGPGNLGTMPMEMKERDTVQRNYHDEVDACMDSKGYTRSDAKQN